MVIFIGNSPSNSWWYSFLEIASSYDDIQLGMPSSQVTKSIIFQRGRVETTNQMVIETENGTNHDRSWDMTWNLSALSRCILNHLIGLEMSFLCDNGNAMR